MSDQYSKSQLEAQLAFQKQLNQITSQIHSATSTNVIMASLTPRIKELLQCERLTIYALNTKTNELYSVKMPGQAPRLISIPRDFNSIAGYCAATRKAVNVRNAYDPNELLRINEKLRHDARWDQKLGFRTTQVLACPLIYDKYLLGVIQLINKQNGDFFSGADLEATREIARTLAVAFYNLNKSGRKKSPKRSKFHDLLERGLLSAGELEAAQQLARENRQDLSSVLMNQYQIPKQVIEQSLSRYFNCPFFSYDGSQVAPTEVMQETQIDFWKRIGCAPVGLEGGTLLVAMPDPYDLNRFDLVKSLGLAPKVEIMAGLTQDIMDYLDHSYGSVEPPKEIELSRDQSPDMGGDAGEMEEILEELEGVNYGLAEDDDEEEEEEELENEELQGAIVRLANKIITDAHRQGVSDIHIEPNGTNKPCKIRFRRDGECYLYYKIPATHRSPLISRIKIMAHLDISEKRKPQDGKIRFRLPNNKVIELRVAVVPTAGSGNEDVVMRLLAASEPLPLEKLGMHPNNMHTFQEAIKNPYGLILCVGPTGSGKTTTLHSALGHINDDSIKIWTAEDPVEITQDGLRQVQVRPKIGFTFAAAIRAFLRADPDVVMIGEMRDKETASTGIEASLTGHLVFSTLHTNTAPETVTRLLDMGLDPFNFADALLAVLAQRLVRTLCKSCKEPYTPDQEEFNKYRDLYGPELWDKRLAIGYSPELQIYRAKGCDSCAGTGYRGRMGLHELLIGSDELKKMILERKLVDDIRELAISQGMTTLLQDGIWKVFQGHTDFEMVRSVCMR